MARITVEDCLKLTENQYDLVLLAKERTSQLNSGSEMLVPEDNDKKTVIALREIAEGKVDVKNLRNEAVQRLRKEPDQNQEEEEKEETIGDDFDSQYKGEVSKSGVAILPSKRMRKNPTPNINQQVEKKEESNEETLENEEPLKLDKEVNTEE
tara:strand:+ start:1222 stop:1680 length:459 start_codon:yes stop_codon:yes gene_type:complete